jgi:hypothetical protein
VAGEYSYAKQDGEELLVEIRTEGTTEGLTT